MYSRVLDNVWSNAGLCIVGCWTMYDRMLDYVVCTVGCWTMYGRVLDYVICKIGC